MKNLFYFSIALLLLAGCKEKPVVINDPRKNPEQFIKVDSSIRELQVLKQDTYLNDLDPNAGIAIETDRVNMFYRTDSDTVNDYYDYTINQEFNGRSTASDGVSYLHLSKDGQVLDYEILKNDRSTLRFRFMRDSTIHEYFPEKKPGKIPTVIPD